MHVQLMVTSILNGELILDVQFLISDLETGKPMCYNILHLYKNNIKTKRVYVTQIDIWTFKKVTYYHTCPNNHDWFDIETPETPGKPFEKHNKTKKGEKL